MFDRMKNFDEGPYGSTPCFTNMTTLENRPISNFYGSWVIKESCDETELRSQFPIYRQVDYVYYVKQCKTNELAYFKLDQD